MAPSSDALVAELRRLRLLSDDAAERVGRTRPGDRPPADDSLLGSLTDAGLTRFQARAVLAGQASRLLFGPYVLLDKIGEGGMGVVYKARHARLGRVDAVKVLRTDKLASRSVARRFLREIQVTSRLEHPHIVRAYDAGRVGRQLYLATEYVPGTDLATLVGARGPMTIADACLVVYQAALALGHIHEKGLVHRDLKPSNLIRDHATGAVKLLDLGLSGFNRAVLNPSFCGTLTRDGVVLGTPDFMAPEQVRDPHAVDIRADLYSLGCTLYFLLTGRPLYEGTAVQKMLYHGSAPPPPLILPCGLSPPPALAGIFARLVAKSPDDRFQTPAQLTDALLAIRPGSGATPAAATQRLVGATTPLPLEPLPAGDFDHLFSHPGTQVFTPRSDSDAAGVSRWAVGIAASLLFGLGFVATALYFLKGR